MANELSPMASGPGGQALGPMAGPGPGDPRAAFTKTSGAIKMLDTVRIGLAELAQMGDLVTPEDVIKTAGKLVGAGIGANAMAGLLADMPEGGQALQAWVASHVQQVTAREAQLAPVHAIARHNMAMGALQTLAKHQTLAGQAPPASPNGLGAPSNG